MIDLAEVATPPVRESLETLAISMGLGGVVGLQRQHAESRIAGIRTFPLITLLGTLSGMLFTFNQLLGSLMIVMGFVGVIAASGLGNYLRARPWASPQVNAQGEPKTGSGITTEMAILIMYAVGVYVVFGPTVIAFAVTGGVALLLYAKQLLHRFVQSLGEKDVHAIMQFLLLACVILPILPDEGFGPYKVLNPRNIWMVIVLVSGIGLGGYIAYKLFGERAGTMLGGILGGMISSTATTVSFARRAREGDRYVARSAMTAIMLASSMVFVRLFVEISAVAPQHLDRMGPPLAVIGGLTALLAVLLYTITRSDGQSMPPQQNPTNLKTAFIFGGIYSLVTLGAVAAQDHFGSHGLYVVASISGLTDMDAITLSSGRAVTNGLMHPDDAWRAIAIALISSMVTKVGICALMGNRRLLLRAVALFAINAAGAAAIINFWPRDQSGLTITSEPGLDSNSAPNLPQGEVESIDPVSSPPSQPNP
jgi:uncharacterized membrane protein (DUF4010 family)